MERQPIEWEKIFIHIQLMLVLSSYLHLFQNITFPLLKNIHHILYPQLGIKTQIWVFFMLNHLCCLFSVRNYLGDLLEAIRQKTYGTLAGCISILSFSSGSVGPYVHPTNSHIFCKLLKIDKLLLIQNDLRSGDRNRYLEHWLEGTVFACLSGKHHQVSVSDRFMARKIQAHLSTRERQMRK